MQDVCFYSNSDDNYKLENELIYKFLLKGKFNELKDNLKRVDLQNCLLLLDNSFPSSHSRIYDINHLDTVFNFNHIFLQYNNEAGNVEIGNSDWLLWLKTSSNNLYKDFILLSYLSLDLTFLLKYANNLEEYIYWNIFFYVNHTIIKKYIFIRKILSDQMILLAEAGAIEEKFESNSPYEIYYFLFSKKKENSFGFEIPLLDKDSFIQGLESILSTDIKFDQEKDEYSINSSFNSKHDKHGSLIFSNQKMENQLLSRQKNDQKEFYIFDLLVLSLKNYVNSQFHNNNNNNQKFDEILNYIQNAFENFNKSNFSGKSIEDKKKDKIFLYYFVNNTINITHNSNMTMLYSKINENLKYSICEDFLESNINPHIMLEFCLSLNDKHLQKEIISDFMAKKDSEIHSTFVKTKLKSIFNQFEIDKIFELVLEKKRSSNQYLQTSNIINNVKLNKGNHNIDLILKKHHIKRQI